MEVERLSTVRDIQLVLSLSRNGFVYLLLGLPSERCVDIPRPPRD